MPHSFTLKSLSHHAYLLVGGVSIKDELISILNGEHGIRVQGNQDFFQRKYESFTIDDARELKLAHEMRPVENDGRKIFIIVADSVTSEAQNALLKLLEEPADYAHFFIIVPSAHLLLPTVKSRLSIVDIKRAFTSSKNTTSVDSSGSGTPPPQGVGVGSSRNQGGRGEKITDEESESELQLKLGAQKFIDSIPAKRLEQIKKLVDDISKEKKTKQDAINFLNAIQLEIYNSSKNTKAGLVSDKSGQMSNIEALETIQTASKHVNDRSPSIKMLLEYVALSI